MTYQKPPTAIFKWLFILCVCLYSNHTLSQCAGTDGSVTICNKDADTDNRTFSLFPHLTGTPVSGGTWSTVDPANFFALNESTGIIDLWRINNFGIHQFTYTNLSCGESATVTINLGGFPGEDNIDGSANACSDDPAVNLHTFLGSETDGKVQDFNGLWEEDPSTTTGFLDKYFFNAEAAGPGIYIFTYTVAAVSICSSRASTVILEVHPAANSGTPIDFTRCTNEDFSPYTNFDLNSRLVGEDLNGTWSESGTNQLDNLSDSVINIEDINNNLGYGTYSFTYTVFPSHPVCEKNETIVNIDILPVLDGTMIVSNFCIGSDYIVDLTYNDTILHNGSFLLQYQVAGNTGTSSAVLQNGTGTFMVDSNLVSVNQMVPLDITGIEGVTPMRDVCPNSIVPQTSFLVSNSRADAADICVFTDASVTLSNVLDSSGNRASGNFSVDYTLTDPDGAVSNSNLPNINFTDGDGAFAIDGANFNEGGDYDLNINIANTFPIDCEMSDILTVTPAPEAIQLDLQVDNNCNATLIDVIIDAPLLSTGTYTITYEVTELNSSNVLTTNTINFNGGTANYQIDVAALPQGNYTARVQSTQNDATPCRIEFDFELNENFAIEGVPALPVAETQQTICLSEFAPDAPTLANIEVSANGQILFYATETDMVILALDAPLVDGEDYFISNIDPDNNCEGSDRIQVTVTLADPEMPMTINANPVFCGSENAMVSSLNASVSSSGNLVWFESASGGTALAESTLLVHGKSYFAATEANGQCLSTGRLEIVPTVYGLQPASLQFSNLAICGLDNPAVADLRDVESDNPFEVLWYDSPENGNPLDDAFLLEAGMTYYAESFNPETGCINPERIAVTVDLTNCDPEDYGFFIPDGFSPNSDGRNDTFFVPNIEIIFPDYTLEILNRYGTTLFKGDRNDSAWDGSNGGGMAPNGVYFYVVDYNKEGHNPVQGRLYLNR